MRDLVPCARCHRHIAAGAACPFCARRAAGLAMIVAASVSAAACSSENKPTPEVPIDTAASAASAAPTVAPPATAEPTPVAPAASATPSAAPTTVTSAAPSAQPTVAPTTPATVPDRPRPKYGIARPQPKYGIPSPP